MDSGLPLLAVSNGITSVVTNLMADGPAAAAVGPITLNMAGLVHPGSTYLPFMAMSTAIASSFAYCLIIGTPPNAIVYASGYLEPKDFLRVGIPHVVSRQYPVACAYGGLLGSQGFWRTSRLLVHWRSTTIIFKMKPENYQS